MRKKLIKLIEHIVVPYFATEIADHLIENDAVIVVRCKDCVNRTQFDTNKFHCELTGYYCGEMGYCSDGIRKEDAP